MLTGGVTYTITGTQFNGLSGGSAFGDESQNATNYPLVRITNGATGHVFYAKTHGNSTMGVATGSALTYTSFDVPNLIEAGASTIQVVANGIPSAPVSVTVVSTAPAIASISPNSGASSGGNSVVITGTNFDSLTTVSFGGTAATVKSVTSTSLTAIVPAHAAGAVTVSVTNSTGQAATLNNGYTYVAVLTIKSVSPTSGSRFGGTNVTITGTNFVSGATVTFGGNRASVQSLSATTIRVRTAAHATGTVSVTVTDLSGQSATLNNAYAYR